jgi:hypothetical protein
MDDELPDPNSLIAEFIQREHEPGGAAVLTKGDLTVAEARDYIAAIANGQL